jgi:hypothetical protein
MGHVTDGSRPSLGRSAPGSPLFYPDFAPPDIVNVMSIDPTVFRTDFSTTLEQIDSVYCIRWEYPLRGTDIGIGRCRYCQAG